MDIFYCISSEYGYTRANKRSDIYEYILSVILNDF